MEDQHMLTGKLSTSEVEAKKDRLQVRDEHSTIIFLAETAARKGKVRELKDLYDMLVIENEDIDAIKEAKSEYIKFLKTPHPIRNIVIFSPISCAVNFWKPIFNADDFNNFQE